LVEARLTELESARSSDVVARLADARELERHIGDGAPLMRTRLVIADMLHRVGEVPESMRLATEVQAWAERYADPGVLARAHLVQSSIFEGIGDGAASLEHAMSAVELQPPDCPLRDRGLYLMRLADALAVNGFVDESRTRYREAEAVFAQIGDRPLLLTTLNNLTVLEWEAGARDAAADAAARLYRAAAPDQLNADFADTIARARLLSGDLRGADEIVRYGYLLWCGQGDSQAATPAELALTRTRVLLAMGDHAAAVLQLEECLAICEQRGLHGIRVQALEVRAETLAEGGDYEAAYHAYRIFHEESERRRSQRLEAVARARHAVLQTDEARRLAQQFWEQARRDPLTGLYNRRYIDERLPGLLTLAEPERGCLVTVVVDIDRFKQINDRYGHDTGDLVLSALARLLTTCLSDPERDPYAAADFAARLGGEEFLVVLGRASPARALDDAEALRVTVERFGWADIEPTLHVTISAGLAVAGTDDTQRSLLSRADGYLYEAKQTGRNRVVAEPP
jgi:diguanylate cyclase (GGDEF)-like protein